MRLARGSTTSNCDCQPQGIKGSCVVCRPQYTSELYASQDRCVLLQVYQTNKPRKPNSRTARYNFVAILLLRPMLKQPVLQLEFKTLLPFRSAPNAGVGQVERANAKGVVVVPRTLPRAFDVL